MTKKIHITPSELVLSAIFFLQQKNGVSEKEITRFISRRVGCKQSLLSKEVKEALDKAIENGIFTKKQGLYRIESSIGHDLKSVKKNLANDNIKDEDFDLQEDVQSPFKSYERTEDRWLTGDSQSSKSDRISLDQLDLLKSKGLEDDDDEEDFLEDEDDELDFFDDDQFSDSYSPKRESPPVKSTCNKHKKKHKKGNKGGKNGGPSKGKRKSLKPRQRMLRRKKQFMCTCKNSEYSSRAPMKSSRRHRGGNEVSAKKETNRGHRKQTKQKQKAGETDKNGVVSKRGKKANKVKDSNAQYGSGRFCKECNCNTVQEVKRDVENQDRPDEAQKVIAKEDQAKKNPKEEQQQQLKRKGKDAKNNEEKEASKKTEDTAPKKDGKAQAPVVKAANPNDVPPEREWRRRKAKRERSSSLFRPIKKKVSSKDKSLLEQKSAKNKTCK